MQGPTVGSGRAEKWIETEGFLNEAVGMLQELGMDPKAVEGDRRAKATVCMLGAIALELRKLNVSLALLIKRNNMTMRQD